jgi:integrase/recombinase XerD
MGARGSGTGAPRPRIKVEGPLALYAAGWRAELAARGYARGSAASQMRLMEHLSRYLDEHGLAVADLTVQAADRFLAQRRAGTHPGLASPRALRPLLGYLRSIGAAPGPAVQAAGSPREVLVEAYRAYLAGERGLAPQSVRSYLGTARAFLSALAADSPGTGLESLSVGQVASFILYATRGRSAASAKIMVTGLRSLLRYLYVEGLVPVPLAQAVPSAAGWKLSSLPRALGPATVASLLAACDRGTATGRRDYAVLMLLARLGLRGCEVAALELDDIDWRAGELVICGKGNRLERLPLPADVGEALAAYVTGGRPRCGCRRLFIRAAAPREGLSPSLARNVVASAAARAGLGRIGAHQLRHTLASEMLRRGAPLAEIGQVLRHRDPLTTPIYAKADQSALRALARPWPGGAA